jgi:3-oxoacyl-[acyl-carrier-protein] synthase II
MARRVVITGMGVLSPIGNSVSEFNFGLRSGQNGIGPITHFDTTDYSVHIAGEVIINIEEKINRSEPIHSIAFPAVNLFFNVDYYFSGNMDTIIRRIEMRNGTDSILATS